MINLIILTAVYGAGRSIALRTFEENGYSVTDNIPASLTSSFLEETANSNENDKVALFTNLENALETYKEAVKNPNFNVKFVGITSSEEILHQRYKLANRLHPRQIKGLSLEESIKKDLELIRSLRGEFDVFVDTTKLLDNEYRTLLQEVCVGTKLNFTLQFFSFGYKLSVPQDIETVFDARVLPDPDLIKELEPLTGLDAKVKDYVLGLPETQEYIKHLTTYIDYYIDQLQQNYRHHASIAIACSKGQKRSVVIAQYLADLYSKKYRTAVSHKDLKY